MFLCSEHSREKFGSCSDGEIANAERGLGLQLPLEYRNLLRDVGGGVLDEGGRFCFPVRQLEEGYYIGLESTFGLHGGTIDLLESPSLMGPDRWGVPMELLIFSMSTSGPGESVGINYGLQQFPPMSIIYIGIGRGNCMIKLADSFGDFIDGLTFAPDDWTSSD
ncbi:SMI1/KNR4 family protein [Corynebacterium sp. NPDC060344]|uniref:SMI1/KNR4 family protein n=1 Tax=Corynebacterium sp. NPDC060344 TaxID=3347101 RepID=UPI003666BCE9